MAFLARPAQEFIDSVFRIYTFAPVEVAVGDLAIEFPAQTDIMYEMRPGAADVQRSKIDASFPEIAPKRFPVP